jgi:hypothetical protein
MIVVHFPQGKRTTPTTVEINVDHEVAQRLAILPSNYLDAIEQKFRRLVTFEFDRWQETMV